MTRVICIASGQLQPKKVDTPLNRRHRYLNYGLLSLASVLKRRGLDPIVIHGHFDLPASVLRKAIEQGLGSSPYALLLSVPSFYAMSWAKEFVLLVKRAFPAVRVIVGGRWVVDDQPEALKARIPGVDVVVSGLAEGRIAHDLGLHASPLSRLDPMTGLQPDRPLQLDYSLLHERHLYQPSIEIARGCGMGCSFCQERAEPLQSLKSPTSLVSELRQTILRDDLRPMTPYLETSMFVPTRTWAEDLRSTMEASNFGVQWRTEGRVDNIQPELIPLLARAGLRVLDLGLESASARQLLAMRKTKSPASYLARASRLMEACKASNVLVKVNLLLFAGENDDTVAETLAWMDAHKALIFGVSVGPVIVFGWQNKIHGYLQELHDLGATVSHSPCEGVTHLNLSAHVDHARAHAIAKKISRRYMPADHYFLLKSFSYFGRDYRFDQFIEDAVSAPDDLSFRLPEDLLPPPEVMAA